MGHVWRFWFGFAVVLGVLLAALFFLSVTALRLDQAEAAARRQAAIDENVRLALWRIDSALAPHLAYENAHPFYQGSGGSSRGDSSNISFQAGSAASPPADGDAPRHVLLRFQFAVDGSQTVAARLASSFPNGLSDLSADVRPPAYPSPPLNELVHQVPFQPLVERLPPASAPSPFAVSVATEPASLPPPLARVDASRKSRAVLEFQQRSQSLATNNAMVQQLNARPSLADASPGPMLTPLWVSNEMVLARRIRRDGQELVQGCLLDWPATRQWLLEMVEDLLPNARLQPLQEIDAAREAGLVAAFPVRLQPGRLPDALPQRRSAVPQTLAIAWFAVLLASCAGVVLLVGVTRLSQRRAAFVSAVTHELRTPLTTFRMYTEMLAQGMVPDAEARQSYLQTLHEESLRLSHMIENVLAYARLERGRGSRALEAISLSRMLVAVQPTLQRTATAAQMELVIEPSPAWDLPVRANRSAVEQVLVNLVDNASKYARHASDRRITLSAEQAGRWAKLRVRDHGPGLSRKRRWFQPFSKTAQEAAHSAPGVGLGLALSRRLAQQMGGALEVDRAVRNGAALVLRLERAG